MLDTGISLALNRVLRPDTMMVATNTADVLETRQFIAPSDLPVGTNNIIPAVGTTDIMNSGRKEPAAQTFTPAPLTAQQPAPEKGFWAKAKDFLFSPEQYMIKEPNPLRGLEGGWGKFFNAPVIGEALDMLYVPMNMFSKAYAATLEPTVIKPLGGLVEFGRAGGQQGAGPEFPKSPELDEYYSKQKELWDRDGWRAIWSDKWAENYNDLQLPWWERLIVEAGVDPLNLLPLGAGIISKIKTPAEFSIKMGGKAAVKAMPGASKLDILLVGLGPDEASQASEELGKVMDDLLPKLKSEKVRAEYMKPYEELKRRFAQWQSGEAFGRAGLSEEDIAKTLKTKAEIEAKSALESSLSKPPVPPSKYQDRWIPVKDKSKKIGMVFQSAEEQELSEIMGRLAGDDISKYPKITSPMEDINREVAETIQKQTLAERMEAGKGTFKEIQKATRQAELEANYQRWKDNNVLSYTLSQLEKQYKGTGIPANKVEELITKAPKIEKPLVVQPVVTKPVASPPVKAAPKPVVKETVPVKKEVTKVAPATAKGKFRYIDDYLESLKSQGVTEQQLFKELRQNFDVLKGVSDVDIKNMIDDFVKAGKLEKVTAGKSILYGGK